MPASFVNSNEQQPSLEQELSIAERIKAARESVSYSLDDLALTCGLTHAELSDIERGTDLDEAKLKRIAAALQIPFTALLADVR
ncbi:helix-turn-helix domain-containing protein [Agrobacterium sp. SHOUNA12C]|nr:helix-turn-helix domain-containing protein [Agrobacterium sp. BETTINA12B]MCJ9757085.1 helix-turn-helix domain-containing protein [Agrobacterium sp. SHOUNA12C]